MSSETTSYKRKYGKKIGNIHTPKAVAYHKQSHDCRFMIGHSLGRMGGPNTKARYPRRSAQQGVSSGPHCGWRGRRECLVPIISHAFINLRKMFNTLWYLYGRPHVWSGTTSYKRKCGKKIGNIHTPKAVTYHKQSHYCSFMIGYSLGRMGGQRCGTCHVLIVTVHAPPATRLGPRHGLQASTHTG